MPTTGGGPYPCCCHPRLPNGELHDYGLTAGHAHPTGATNCSDRFRLADWNAANVQATPTPVFPGGGHRKLETASGDYHIGQTRRQAEPVQCQGRRRRHRCPIRRVIYNRQGSCAFPSQRLVRVRRCRHRIKRTGLQPVLGKVCPLRLIAVGSTRNTDHRLESAESIQRLTELK